MNKENFFVVDVYAKFFNFIRIEGWFVSSKKIQKIKLIAGNLHSQVSEIYFEYPQVVLEGAYGWKIDAFFSGDFDPLNSRIEVSYGFFKTEIFQISELIDRRLSMELNKPKATFFELLSKSVSPKVLDIGGRDRSKIDRSTYIKNGEVTVLDIHPGENVDVVGDAHALSKYFKPNTFDFAMSFCVFEHLHTPWQVAIELNKVLKKDGYALILTHQTLGLHDMPWDFYRYSSDAFKSIFNEYTGFEIVSDAMIFPSYIVPSIYREDKCDAEKSIGFELSTVLVRKMGDSIAQWSNNLSESLGTTYPLSETSFDPSTMKLPF